MAVDKKELLARYKELKAQGVSVSLADLKAQMDSEASAQNASLCEPLPPPESQTSTQTNFPQQEQSFEQQCPVNPEKNNAQPEAPAYVSSFTQGFMPAQSSEPEPPQNTWTTVQTQPTEPYQQIQPAQHTYEMQPAQLLTTQSIENYSQPQGFSQAQIEPQQNTTAPAKYTGNITEQMIQSVNAQSQQANKYCLIGYPLGHSLSTYIHNAGFKSLGLNYTYEILETPSDTLVDRIKYLKHNNFAGFNVTIPLKLPVTLFLNEIDASADIVGAVNTVIIRPDKTLKGYNTDVIGFFNAIPKDFTVAGKTAGILGTGGAARAAITALAQNQAKEIKLYTRNVPNAIELLNFLRSKFPATEFNAFQIEHIRDLSDINILVNTTPIGMQGRGADYTPVEEEQLRTLPQGAIVYDVIYNPKKTILLKLAQKNGYRTINGVDMFIHQAVAAQQIWTGQTPDFKDMKIAALENL